MKCAQTFLITEQNMSYLIIPYKTIQMINFANGTVTDICYTTLQWVVKFSQNIAKTKIKAKVCFHFIHSLQDLKVSFRNGNESGGVAGLLLFDLLFNSLLN